jgi:hypothetical protein
MIKVQLRQSQDAWTRRLTTAAAAIAFALPFMVVVSVASAPPAAAANTQSQLIQRLKNTQAFLQHPVDPQDLAQLPGSPYSAILAVLTPFIQEVTSETTGGAILTPTQLTELGNVDQVLSLLVDRVATTGTESPQALAEANANITTGEWGIAYETSLIMGTRFVGIAANLGDLAISALPVWQDIQGTVANGADSELLSITQDLSIQTDQYLAWAVEGGSETLKESLKTLVTTLGTQALSLQAVGQGMAHQIADLLLSLNGYEVSPYVADALLIAESQPNALSTATVQQVLTTLHGPASIALETYDQLQATFTYGPVHTLLKIVDLLPFVGSVSSITQSLSAIGGNIGGNAVDAMYLYSAAGVPDPHLLTDTLLYGWISGVEKLLGQPITAGNSEATGLTLNSISPLPGWCGTQPSGVPLCQLGSQVGFHGVVTNALGQPVVGARVAVSSNGGSVETATVTTNDSGAFADGVTLPTSEGQTITVTASVPGGSAPPESLSYETGPGTLYQVQFEGEHSYPAGSTTLPLAVLVLDAHGNLIPDQPITISTTVGSVTPTTTTSGSAGFTQATVSFPAGTTALTIHAAVGGSALEATFPATASRAPTVTMGVANVSGFTVSVPGSVTTTSTGTSVTKMTWTWGDGTHGNGPFPQQHTYAEAGTYTVSVTATDSNGATGSASTKVAVSAPPTNAITVSPGSLPGATVGVAYSTRISVTGGLPPYKVTWTSLPPGFAVYTPYVLSGTPIQAGSYDVAVTVTDSSSPNRSVRSVLSVTVAPESSLSDSVSFRQETSTGTFLVNTCSKESWLVTLGGVTESCAQAGNGPVYIHFHMPPGTYPFTVSVPSGIAVSPASGVLTVASSTVTEPLVFSSGPSSTGWSESLLPDHQTFQYYQTLACSGTHCYERGVVRTGTHTDALGLWSSTDAGRTWTASPFLLPGVNLVQSCGTSGTGSMTGCLVAVGSDAFTLGPKSATTLPSALWATTDGGASWTEHPIGSTFYGTLLSCPTSSYCAAAGDYNGTPALFVSTDGGTSWSEHPIPGLSSYSELSCPEPGTCVVTGGGSALVTSDSGATWATFGPSTSARAVSCTSIQTCWESTGTRVLVTNDAGATWTSAGTVGPGAGGVVQLDCLTQTICTAISSADVAYTTVDATIWTRLVLPSNFLSLSGAFSSQDALVLGVDQGNAPAVWTAALDTVVTAPTTTSAELPTAAVVGQPTNVPVRVSGDASGPGDPTPQGRVKVEATASTGATQSCTATVAGSTGVAVGSCALVVDMTGSYSVSASYGGAENFRASTTAAVSLNVSPGLVSAVVTLPSGLVQGQSQTVDIRLVAEYASQGVPAPTGSVEVSLGKATCTAELYGSTGASTGSCVLEVDTSGALATTLTYVGGGDFAGAHITGGVVTVAPARISTPPATPTATTRPPPGNSPPPVSKTAGYDLVGADGGVFVFSPPGTSGGFYGSLPGLGVVPAAPIVGMVPTVSDQGYFLVGADGGVFSFGNAPFLGSLPGLGVTPSQPITGIVAANTDTGYFLVGRDGGVFAFGKVPFLGSLPGRGISVDNIVGIAATPSGNGYWLVSATGTVYGFGAAMHLGTAKGTPSQVDAIAGTPTGGGYWITSRNGSVYAYGNASYHGSLPGLGVIPALPVIGIVHTSDTQGYWLIGADGGVFAFGDAGFVGSLPGLGVHVTDIVGAVPTQS